MGLLGKLFGTEKALDDITKSVSKSLDTLVYTEQERETSAAKERAEARAAVVGWVEATKGQNLARRLIALSITAVWLSMYMISTALFMLAVFIDEGSRLNEAAEIAKDSAQDMNSAVMLILAFYFAAPHMKSILSRGRG